jgi:hypothetical protein
MPHCLGEKQMMDLFILFLMARAQGLILNSSIDGTIQMKSYLAGNPELKLALNEELVIGKTGARGMPSLSFMKWIHKQMVLCFGSRLCDVANA